VSRSLASRGPYAYQFHVLADPETINAFALPGGQVSITLGLLRRLRTEAELAGVLGHEIGHVIERHGAEQLSKQQFAQSLVGAVGVATYDPNDPGSARNAAIAAAVSQLVSMRFGRQDELEADSTGVHLMSQAGYDPHGMVGLMKVLADAGGGGRQPEFFSTHPNPENRLARIQAQIDGVKGGPAGDTGADRFQANVLRYLREVR
jgi:predicted Zn-dependent protease